MNPFEVDRRSTPSASLEQAQALPTRPRHMNINDTQSIDGLAVHLQSPSLKRRYWNTRYASRYRDLAQMAQWAEAIKTYLHHYHCDALLDVFMQDIAHFEQLTHMKKQLHLDEQHATLSGVEQSVFEHARQLGSVIRVGWDTLRNAWNTANTRSSSDMLAAPARRTLQRWLYQFTSQEKKDKHRMSPALVQDIYRLQAFL
jgi:hypothetical protein